MMKPETQEQTNERIRLLNCVFQDRLSNICSECLTKFKFTGKPYTCYIRRGYGK